MQVGMYCKTLIQDKVIFFLPKYNFICPFIVITHLLFPVIFYDDGISRSSA